MPERPSSFPYFLQLKPGICHKELKIWATVSSKSCFCWLYRASTSLVTKNIINLISVLTVYIHDMAISTYRVVSCFYWKRVFAMTSAFSWQNSISLCPSSFCTPRPNLPVILGMPWLLPFSFQSPNVKDIFFFLMLVLEDLVGLHRTSQLQLLYHLWLGHRLGLLWCWKVLSHLRMLFFLYELKLCQLSD